MPNAIQRRRFLSILLAGGAMGLAAVARAPQPQTQPHRPLVGITSAVRDQRVTVQHAYARAVQEAGGTPVVLPVIEDDAVLADYARRLDALVMTGGRDVPPRAYGEKPHKTVKPLAAARWRFESALARRWLATDKPLLGVCLGAQIVNVVRGGSLVQDIPTQVGGSAVHRKRGGDAVHGVSIEPASRLRKLLAAARVDVASAHHQAVRRVGRGLRVVARSDDGVIEALEGQGQRWLLLVQWHPERMARAHRLALYGALVRACASGR